MKFARKEWFAKKIAAMPDSVVKELRAALADGAEEMVDVAKRFAPVSSGALRNSIGYTFGNYRPENSNVRGVSAGGAGHALSVVIHAGDARAWYAALVEFGTLPHEIKPKRPGGLLNINGRLLESVNHPGSTASPFFFPAYRLTKKRMRARLSRAMRAAVKKAISG